MTSEKPERIRKTAVELNTDAQLSSLFAMVDQLAMHVRAALPSAAIPDFRNGYYGIHPPVALDGPALISGRGPRFCAKYNLARSDEERQALLDSLPNFGSWSYGRFELRGLMEEYRTSALPYGKDSNRASPIAKEWVDWHQALVARGAFEVLEEGGVEVIAARLPIDIQADDTVRIADEYLFFEIKDKGEFVLLPVPEEQTYLVLKNDLCNYSNAGLMWRVEPEAVIRWSAHELCWTVLGHQSIRQTTFIDTLTRWTESIGYPKYETVPDDEMVVLFENALQRLRNDWLDAKKLDRKIIEKRSITLDGVLRLEIQTPRPSSHYSEWSLECFFLDSPEDIEKRSRFLLARHNGYGQSLDKLESIFYVKESGYDSGKIQNTFKHHPRQRARIKALIERFIHTPNEELKFEDVIRPEYERHEPDDD